MGAGSAALLWYACCCGFVAFTGIITIGLIVYGRKREARVRSLGPVGEEAPVEAPNSEPQDEQDAEVDAVGDEPEPSPAS